MLSLSVLVVALLPWLGTSQLIQDPGTAGPPLELMHLYYDEWPTGELRSSPLLEGVHTDKHTGLTQCNRNCRLIYWPHVFELPW